MASPAPIPPVLQQVMVSLERETGLSMSFDDLTGWVREGGPGVAPLPAVLELSVIAAPAG